MSAILSVLVLALLLVLIVTTWRRLSVLIRGGRRGLLMVYIHGFASDEETFQRFPFDVKQSLQASLKSHSILPPLIYTSYPVSTSSRLVDSSYTGCGSCVAGEYNLWKRELVTDDLKLSSLTWYLFLHYKTIGYVPVD